MSELEGFWSSIWDFFEVISDVPPTRALGAREMPGAEWFPGTRVNYAEHVFRDRDPSQTAILHASELRPLSELSWGELRSQVAATAAGLRSLGVETGDRVVAYLPNVPGGDRRLPRQRLDRRGLVLLLARFRPLERGRPLRPDRAQGAARCRRLPLRRQGLRPHRGARRPPGRDARASSERSYCPTSPLTRSSRDCGRRSAGTELLGRRRRRRAQLRATVPSPTPSGSSTPPGPPDCRRRSSRARAGSSSST